MALGPSSNSRPSRSVLEGYTDTPKTDFDKEVEKAQIEITKRVAHNALKNRTETTVIKDFLSNRAYSIHSDNQIQLAKDLRSEVEKFRKPKGWISKLIHVLVSVFTGSRSTSLDELIQKTNKIKEEDCQFVKGSPPSHLQGTVRLLPKGASLPKTINEVANRMLEGLKALKEQEKNASSLQNRVHPHGSFVQSIEALSARILTR